MLIFLVGKRGVFTMAGFCGHSISSGDNKDFFGKKSEN